MKQETVVAALTVALDPLSILLWLVVGLIAGFLASRVMRGGGYGLVGDIVVGLIVAFIGACILLAILPAASGQRSWRRQ